MGGASGVCTKELVMVDVAMECPGDRFRIGDHAMVSLAPLKETLFDPVQMQRVQSARVMTTSVAWTGQR